jgi:hypothetical protein
MPTSGGGTRPADAGQATCSCSGGHLPAAAVAAADTYRLRQWLRRTPTGCGSGCGGHQPSGQPPSRHRPCGHRPRFWEQQRTAKAPAVSGSAATPDIGRGVRLRQDGGGPAAAVPARRQGRARRICSSALVKWPGQRSQGERLSGCADTGCGLPDTGSPHAPARRTPATAAGMGTLRQRPCWTAGSRTVHHPAAMSDRNGTPMCGTGQHARLTARSVVWRRPET